MTSKTSISIVMCLASYFLIVSGKVAGAQMVVPVIVGGDRAMDACGSVGAVSGLDPSGSNLLSVRSGPGTEYERVDLIATDQVVWICDHVESWYSIVYSKTDQICEVSTPIAEEIEYAGPCSSGWVFRDYVADIAG